jgi:hypothetical protein
MQNKQQGRKIMKAFFFPFLALSCFSISLFSSDVNNAASLEAAIISANAGTSTTIDFTDSFSYSQIFRPLNTTQSFSPANQTITIRGHNKTLSTTENWRGFLYEEE